MRNGGINAARSRWAGAMRSRSDEPRNHRLRLRVRAMLRQESRLERLLPMSRRTLVLWLIGAIWLDDKYIHEMEIATDWVFNQYLTKGIR